MSLAKIAEKVGFADAGTLPRQLQRFFGLAPSEIGLGRAEHFSVARFEQWRANALDAATVEQVRRELEGPGPPEPLLEIAGEARAEVLDLALKAVFAQPEAQRPLLLAEIGPAAEIQEALHVRSRITGRLDRARGLDLAELALASVESAGERLGQDDPTLRALAWARLGNARLLASDPTEANEAFRRAMEVIRNNEVEARARAEILKFQGTFHMFSRRLEEARDLLDEAIGLGRAAKADKIVLDALIQRATVLAQLADLKSAVSDLRVARRMLIRGSVGLGQGDQQRLLAGTTGNLVLALTLDGQAEEAEKLLPEASRLARAAEDRAYWLQLRWISGTLHRQKGDLATAEGLLREARDGFIEIDDPGLTAVVSLDLALLYHEQGRAAALLSAASDALPALEALQLPETLTALRLLRQAFETREIDHQLLIRLRQDILPGLLFPSPAAESQAPIAPPENPP